MSDLNIQNYKNIDQYLGIYRNEKILKYFVFSHILLFKKKKLMRRILTGFTFRTN